MNRTEDRIFDSPEVTGFVRKTAEHCKSMDKHTALKAGVNLRDMFWLCNAKTPQEAQTRVEFFSRTCLTVEEATDQELQELGYDRSNPPNNHQLIFDDPVSAETLYYHKAKVFVIDTSVYMPWLKSLLQGLKNAATGRPRVTFVQRKVTRLSEFTNANIVVNCSGLGAKEIANDNAMVPIRGQYVRIRAPAIQALHFADHSFICPR
uniref:FAD dependent oxidoreductase domain-containing protein n=1 Tax=Ciona savignyi TaxID=51511 RepID=H2ZL75_CIOSA